MQPDVQILLAPQAVKKNKCSLLPEGTDVTAHLAAHSSKIINPLSANVLLCLGITSKN